jgi:hypothetical protein
VRLAFSTVATLVLSSCVTPICWKHTFGATNSQLFASIDILSEPLQSPALDPSRFGWGVWFGHKANIVVDDRGGKVTYDGSSWPEGCVTVSAEELAAVSRSWAPVLERVAEQMKRAGKRTMTSYRMEHPLTDESWRPYGPVMSLSFGPPAGTSFRLVWDGQASLPEDIDAAVSRTLEMFCSKGRNARRILLRDLPQQVVARLECARELTP